MQGGTEGLLLCDQPTQRCVHPAVYMQGRPAQQSSICQLLSVHWLAGYEKKQRIHHKWT